MNNVIPRLKILFFTSIICQFIFAVLVSVYFGQVDQYFYQSLFNFFSSFVLIAFLLFLSAELIKQKKFNPFQIALFFKLLIAINFIVIYLFLKGDLYLNNTGDDHTYINFGYAYKNNIAGFISNEWSSYAAPYGFFSVLTSTFLLDPNILRLIQFFVSIITAIYFYKFLRLQQFDEQISKIVFCLFVLTPAFTFFSIFVFKDTFILFCIVYILFQINRDTRNSIDYIKILLCYSLIFFLRPSLMIILIAYHLLNTKVTPFTFVRYKIFIRLIFIATVLGILIFLWVNFLNSSQVFSFLDYRLNQTTLNLTGDIRFDFLSSFLTALMSMIVMPPVFADFNTPWSIQESAYVFGRMFNYFLFIIFCFGITDYKRINFNSISIFVCIIAICLGMALLGQFLSDRHKLILLPFGFYFVAKGLQRIKHIKPSSMYIIFMFFSFISLFAQYIFIDARIISHGY